MVTACAGKRRPQQPPPSSSSSGSIDNDWLPGQYSGYNTKNLVYDEWTTHNLKTRNFTTNLNSIVNPQDPLIDQMTVRQYWNNEETWAEDLNNIGSTYCNDCDTSLFDGDTAMDGDITTLQIPLSWQQCGVYHNSLVSDGTFSDIYTALNSITWQPTTVLQSLSTYDFSTGYNDGGSTYELVHVYHRPSGYYYWEIRKNTGSWNTILRSQLKAKEHSLSDLSSVDPNYPWHVESSIFLNGNDIDCSGDRWSSSIVDPSTYIGLDVSEIVQVIVNGTINVPLSNQTTLCGKIVPFQETHLGIELINQTATCQTSIMDQVLITTIDYTSTGPSGSGGFIKIMGTLPAGHSTRQEHRFIPREYETVFTPTTNFDLTIISSMDYYILKDYLPLYLFSNSPTNTIKLQWQRYDNNYYSQTIS